MEPLRMQRIASRRRGSAPVMYGRRCGSSEESHTPRRGRDQAGQRSVRNNQDVVSEGKPGYSRARLLWKKRLRMSPHSSAMRPPTTSGR